MGHSLNFYTLFRNCFFFWDSCMLCLAVCPCLLNLDWHMNCYWTVPFDHSVTVTTTYLFIYLFIYFCLFAIFLGRSCSIWRFLGQGSNWSCSLWPTPQPQQHGIWASSGTYTTAHGNARSVTHWVRPGIRPTTSWFLVGFHWAMTVTPRSLNFPLSHDSNSPSLNFNSMLGEQQSELLMETVEWVLSYLLYRRN